MKILHVWDQAGVSCVLAKYQRKLGHQAEVIKREGFDTYGIEAFYGTTIYHGGALGFYRFAVRKSRKYDVVHVHSSTKVVPFIRKPKVLHFHGSDLREAGKWRKLENYMARKFADKVLVSTPDLLSAIPEAEWLPNPVDTELFHPKKPMPSKYKNKTAYEDAIPYRDMPDYLIQHGKHVETKRWALRKLSLEALACGVPVVWNGLIIKGQLPDRHKPENVAKRTIQIYESARLCVQQK